MATGLIALLDDIAMIAKLAASSLDDVAGAAGKAGTKAAGVVIDDAAVTPRYVVGLTPERELPIITKIGIGSLRNKLVFLVPAALLMSAFAPWLITPLLMLGGAYLCFEGAEKVIAVFFAEHHDIPVEDVEPAPPEEVEKHQISGAIRTDFILSGEIIAIALAEVSDQTLLNQAIILLLVSVIITVAVYGVVALIVKMDDIGLHLARENEGFPRKLGLALVDFMPRLLKALSIIGTAAMLWVGGGIIVHGLDGFGLSALPHAIHHLADISGQMVSGGPGAVITWLVSATASGLFGLLLGGMIVGILHKLPFAGHGK